MAVEEQLNVVLTSTDAIVIPPLKIGDFGDVLYYRTSEYFSAARLVIKRTPIILSYIRLKTDHLMVIGNPLGSKLYTRVSIGRTDNFKFQP